MNIKSINVIVGWLVTVLSFVCYLICLEPSVSLWDCGEFISAANKLQVVHPPGAPLFLLIARMFTLIAPDTESIGLYINALSALSSAFTVFFTYHSIVLLVRGVERNHPGMHIPKGLALVSGAIGALALAFSDTFWFSAVETEVYALSSFFTALTFWAALKWYYNDSIFADKWLVLIAYLLGLAIGAHLLSLLVIPSVSFLYFFKMKRFGYKNMSYAFVAGLGILFFIQNGVIPGIPGLFASFELFFVNSLGFGFDTGMLLVVIALIATLGYGLYYFSQVSPRPTIHLSVLCLTYLLLGFSSYTMILVRSREHLPIDMNNPEEPFNLKYYINREQYEERPLLYGPYFNATAVDVKEGAEEYRKDKEGYTLIGNKRSYVFDKSYNVLFPRMGDMQKSTSPMGYRVWSGMDDVEREIQYLEQSVGKANGKEQEDIRMRIEELKTQKPKMINNLRFFFDYQLNHMYVRYFLWNFAGRQNDLQGHSYNRLLDGNWISGIPILDRMRLGPQKNMPVEMSENKGRNVFFMLPLILGLMGVYWHFKSDRRLFTVTGILFLFTGILIIVFLNQPPFEPRERDYVHVGSFQVFCLWIGMGVLQLYKLLGKKLKPFPALILAAISSFSVPALMAQQGWDDHNRSGRYIALDLARNILDSCPKNALFLGNADNDTYPVWYVQNVLGYRKDVRVVNQNLLPSDWYSKQLLTQVYDSKPFKMLLNEQDLNAGVNDYFQWQTAPDSDQPVELETYLRELSKSSRNSFSKHRFYLTVEKSLLLKNKESDWRMDDVKDSMLINFPRRGMHKGDLVLLALVAEAAKSGFERPICFSTIAGDDGYEPYVKYIRKRGMVYVLSPIRTEQSSRDIRAMDTEASFDLLCDKFHYGGIKNNPDFYIDDKSQVFPESLGNCFMELAGEYLNQALILENSARERPDGNAEKQIAELKRKAIRLLTSYENELPVDIARPSSQACMNLSNLWHHLGDTAHSTRFMKLAYAESKARIQYFKSFLNTQYESDYIRSMVEESMAIVERCQQLNTEWNLRIREISQDKSFENLRKQISGQLNG